MTTQCIIPTELICEVLSYTSPLDVVRWRAVSKLFCTIAHDPKIWKALYANAPFLLPPGPFPTVPFERAFVQSARLAQSWTTQRLQTVTCVSVPFDGGITNSKNFLLVGGRWLVVCQLDRRFVLYDTNANGETRAPQVLWEQGEDITAWDQCLATSEEGHWVVYVLLSTEDSPRWTLLEFRLNAESGALYETVTLDVPVLGVDRHLELDGGQKLFSHSPFLTILSQRLVFDMRTRVFHKFPDIYGALDITRSWPLDPEKGNVIGIVPTNTHVILLRHLTNEWTEPHILVQAFTVPDNQRPVESGKGELRLSHEGIFSSDKTIFAVIRNSVVDPITGAISVKLLERHSGCRDFRTTCHIDLTLDKPSLDDVSPITIDRHPVLIEGDVLTHDYIGFCHEYYDISDDGYARGLFMLHRHCSPNESFGLVKFTIDATQDRCVVVLSQFSGAEWDAVLPVDYFSLDNPSALDGVRGKLFYVNNQDSEDQAIIIVDIE